MIEDVKFFINGLPGRIKEVLPDAEDFVCAVEQLSNTLKDGEPRDLAIKKALEFIPGDLDTVVYEKLKDIISLAADWLCMALNEIERKEVYGVSTPEKYYSLAKREIASGLLLESVKTMKPIEANLAVETAVYYLYHA